MRSKRKISKKFNKSLKVKYNKKNKNETLLNRVNCIKHETKKHHFRIKMVDIIDPKINLFKGKKNTFWG